VAVAWAGQAGRQLPPGSWRYGSSAELCPGSDPDSTTRLGDMIFFYRSCSAVFYFVEYEFFMSFCSYSMSAECICKKWMF
jgi:hypothetical protein